MHTSYLTPIELEAVVFHVISCEFPNRSVEFQRAYLLGYFNALYAVQKIDEKTREKLIRLYVLGENSILNDAIEQVEVLDWE